MLQQGGNGLGGEVVTNERVMCGIFSPTDGPETRPNPVRSMRRITKPYLEVTCLRLVPTLLESFMYPIFLPICPDCLF
ncbi:hypothetical protein ACN38_g672 [Penicillium nordicum]|uniref:Uncharacterized protein n=1 Tax=Penicillium nordicum TaxID=229535 RepID=A0A0M8PIH1_9EURO|nr:hypothetical protein ACN38_g672 [Penicillium nordicum]